MVDRPPDVSFQFGVVSWQWLEAFETIGPAPPYSSAPPPRPRSPYARPRRSIPRHDLRAPGQSRSRETTGTGYDEEGYHDQRQCWRERQAEAGYDHGREGQHGLRDRGRAEPSEAPIRAAAPRHGAGAGDCISRWHRSDAPRGSARRTNVPGLGAVVVRRHGLPAHLGGHELRPNRPGSADVPHGECLAGSMAAWDRSLGGSQGAADGDPRRP